MGEVRKPARLKGSAAKSWDGLLEAVNALGVMSAADAPALALLATTEAMMLAIEKEIATPAKRHYMSPQGDRQNPLVGQYDTLADRYVRLLKEFGLTPSARSKVAAVEQHQGTDKTEDDIFTPTTQRRTG